MKKLITAGALALVLVTGLSACSVAPADAPAPAAGGTAISDATILIDVRTPAEYAEGHLDGAINIDVQSPDFDQQLAAFEPGAEYLVYCRSGNRASQAISRMVDLGFSQLGNAGSVEQAADLTGRAIIAE